MSLINNNNRKWWLIASVMLVYLMGNIDYTAVNLALASIANDFHASLSDLQWVINGAILAGTALMVFAGRLSDIIGRKKLFILGSIGFVLTSLMVGFSPNESFLITMRVLQGATCAFAFAVMSPLIFSTFPDSQRGLAIGMLMGASGFGQALGPSLGGFLIHFWGWRWIFFINVPIGIVAIIIGCYSAVSVKTNKAHEKLDYIGAAIFTLALTLLIYVLNESQAWGLLSIKFLGCLLVSFLLLRVFYSYEKSVERPLLDLSLLKNKPYMNFVAIRFFYSFTFGSLLFITGLYLINILQYSVIEAGLILFSLALLNGITSPFTGRLVDLVGVKKPLVLAMLIGGIGLIFDMGFGAAHVFELYHVLWIFIAGLALNGLVVGISQGAPTTGALREVHEDDLGIATGFMFTVAFLSFAISIAVTGCLQYAIGSISAKAALALHHVSMTPARWTTIETFTDGSRSLSTLPEAFSAHIAKLLLPILQQSFSFTFLVIMGVNVIFCIIAFFLSLKIKE